MLLSMEEDWFYCNNWTTTDRPTDTPTNQQKQAFRRPFLYFIVRITHHPIVFHISRSPYLWLSNNRAKMKMRTLFAQWIPFLEGLIYRKHLLQQNSLAFFYFETFKEASAPKFFFSIRDEVFTELKRGVTRNCQRLR